MTFSDQYGYTTPPTLAVEQMSVQLRNALYNVVVARFGVRPLTAPEYLELTVDETSPELHELIRVWLHRQGEVATNVPVYRTEVEPFFSGQFRVDPWYFNFNFIEFILSSDIFDDEPGAAEELADDVNVCLETWGSPWRWSGEQFVSGVSPVEVASVATTIRGDLPPAVAEHFTNAVNKISPQPRPDYANAMKEAVSAAESYVRILVGNKQTLGTNITRNAEALGLPKPLAEAWSKVYGWTSDEAGVRHGGSAAPSVGQAEATYTVVTVSALINFLAEKNPDSLKLAR